MALTYDAASDGHDFMRRLLSVLLVSAAVAAGLLFAAPQSKNTHFHWAPVSTADSGAIVFDRSYPQELEIQFAAVSPRHGGPVAGLLDFGAWGITQDSRGFWIDVYDSQQRFRILDSTCSEGCRFVITPKGGISSSVLVESAAPETLPVASVHSFPFRPEITRFEASELAIESGVNVSGVTRPFGLTSSNIRLALLLTSSAGLLLAGFMWSRGRWRKAIAKLTGRELRAWSLVDLFVLASLASLVLLAPNFSDDQWVIETTRYFSEEGVLSSVFSPETIWLPTGTVFYTFYAAVLAVTGNIFFLRLVPASALMVGWVILRKTLPVAHNAQLVQIWSAALFFVLFSSGWLITLRPEPVVVLLSAIFASSVWNFRTSGNQFHAFLAFISAGLALSTHQSGLVLLFPAVAFALYWAMLFIRSSQRHSFVAVLLSTFTFLTISTFGVYDLKVVLDSVIEWRSFDTHDKGPEDEIFRWTGAMSDALESRSTPILVTAVLIAIALMVPLRPRNTFFSLARWFLILSSAGLVLTASKWAWHLGALAIPALLFFLSLNSVFAANRFYQEPKRAWSLAFAPALVLGVGIVFLTPHDYLIFWAISGGVLGLVYGAIRWFERPGIRGRSRLVIAGSLSFTTSLLLTSWFASAAKELNHFRAVEWQSLPGLSSQKGFGATLLWLPTENPGISGVVSADVIVEDDYWTLNVGGLDSSDTTTHMAIWLKTELDTPELSVVVAGETIRPEEADFLPESVVAANQSHQTWTQFVYQIPVRSKTIKVFPSREILDAARAGGVRVGEVSPKWVRDLDPETTFYGPVYEATEYGEIRLLETESGLWTVPDFIVADRGFSDFAKPLYGADLFSVGNNPSFDSWIFLFSQDTPDNLTLRIEH